MSERSRDSKRPRESETESECGGGLGRLRRFASAKERGRASCSYPTSTNVLHIALTLQNASFRLLIIYLSSITRDIPPRSTVAN